MTRSTRGIRSASFSGRRWLMPSRQQLKRNSLAVDPRTQLLIFLLAPQLEPVSRKL